MRCVQPVANMKKFNKLKYTYVEILLYILNLEKLITKTQFVFLDLKLIVDNVISPSLCVVFCELIDPKDFPHRYSKDDD